MALSVEHFGRTYATATGTFTAVADLSFTVAAGEIVGLIGPNGAGKTTTLRSLAGILRPTSGRVRIDGHDLIEDPLEAKRCLAFMPDEPHLFEYLTVEEHLRLVARLYGVTDFDRRAAVLIEELELKGKERSLPGELSRGMRQKVVIACGLVRNATTLLFDEPLTGLDPIGIRRMRNTIVARARAGAAILLSSHLLHLVEEICSRVIIMDRGQKIADGTCEELASRADLATAGSSLEQIFLRVTGHDTPASST
jgi:ABC-2 type transport system ATP-binding protein